MAEEPTTTEAAMTEPIASEQDKPQITYDDFIKLDLRIATVKHAENHPNADRLLMIQVDDGTEDGRQICAGIKAWYEPEDLIGKQVVIVANLKPRKIRGEMSDGMILAASSKSTDSEEDIIVLSVDRPAQPGSSVS